VAGGRVTVHNVGYREFVERRGSGMRNGGDKEMRRAAPNAPVAPAPRPPGTSSPRPAVPPPKTRSELRATEQEIEALEQRGDALAQKLADPDLYRRSDDYLLVLQEHEEVTTALRRLTERWEELARLVEALS
jgi:hypothetical protein